MFFQFTPASWLNVLLPENHVFSAQKLYKIRTDQSCVNKRINATPQARKKWVFFSQQQFFLYPCYSPPTEPQGLLEGMTVKPLFINIGLGLNSINGYHLTMVISHYAVILQHILIDNTINDCSLLELYALILARRPINPRRE